MTLLPDSTAVKYCNIIENAIAYTTSPAPY